MVSIVWGIQNNLKIRVSSQVSRPNSSSGNFYGSEIRHGIFLGFGFFSTRSSLSLEIRSTPLPPGNPMFSRSFRFYRSFSNPLNCFAILASFPGTESFLMNAFTLYADSKEIIYNKPKSNCSGCCCIPLMLQCLNHHSLVLKLRKV